MIPKELVREIKKLNKMIDMKLPDPDQLPANVLDKTPKMIQRFLDRYSAALSQIGAQQDKVGDLLIPDTMSTLKQASIDVK